MSDKERKTTSRLTIDIPTEYHMRLKALAAICNTSIKEIVIQSIKENIFFDQCSEKEAWKAMEDERDSVEVKELDDLFKKLGI